MTAGQGVSHAEEATGRYRGALHGLQLWVAQPDATRHGAPAFEHHGELPRVELDRCTATVLVGELGGASSPARRDTDHLGADLDLRSGVTALPLDAVHEHALVVMEGMVSVGGRPVTPGQLGYLASGRGSVDLTVAGSARALLVGGTPFPETVSMWWNFVARTRAELDAAYASWRDDDGRFGAVGSTLARIPAPRPFWQV